MWVILSYYRCHEDELTSKLLLSAQLFAWRQPWPCVGILYGIQQVFPQHSSIELDQHCNVEVQAAQCCAAIMYSSCVVCVRQLGEECD